MALLTRHLYVSRLAQLVERVTSTRAPGPGLIGGSSGQTRLGPGLVMTRSVVRVG